MEKWQIDHEIEGGMKYPYDNQPQKKEWQFVAARVVLRNLQGRNGMGGAFDNIDDDVKDEIVDEIAELIRECKIRFLDANQQITQS